MGWLDKLLNKVYGEEAELYKARRKAVKAKEDCSSSSSSSESSESSPAEIEEKEKSRKSRHKARAEKARKATPPSESSESSEEDYGKSRTRKGKKDVKPFLGDTSDEGVSESDMDIDHEPEDLKDEKAELEAARRQKRVVDKTSKAKKSRKSRHSAEKNAQEAIEEDQHAYFPSSSESDLSESEFEMPEEEGHGKGVITNYGRHVDGKTKKSRSTDPVETMVELMGTVAEMLSKSLEGQQKQEKRQQKQEDALAYLIKSTRKAAKDMEMIKSQDGGYPMAPVMYAPTRHKKGEEKQYSAELVRETLFKAMSAGQVGPDTLQDFDAFVGRPGASVNEWVNDNLDENLRKSLSL